VIDELLAAPVRARIQSVRGPSIVKATCSWDELCKRRAQDMYAAAVHTSGGYSPAARRQQCDESTVRDRCHDPRKIPALWHALAGLSRAGLYELASAICDFADQQEAKRHVG
jgi:hypothetical protein